MTVAVRTLLLHCLLVAMVLLSTGTSALAQTVSPLGSAAASSIPSDSILDQAFSQVFKDTLTDFKRLPSRETATWLGIGAAAAMFGRTQDAPLTRTMSASRGLRDALGSGQIIGASPVQLGGAFVTYSLGRMTNSPRAASLGRDLIRAQIVSGAMTYGVKFAAGRTRPDGTSRSFPSGHSADTFATATVLQRHLGWKVGVPAYAVASYVAASRVQMKRHYLSDVAFGAAVGIIAGRTVTVGHGNARFAVAPVATPGGGGVGFTWLGKR
jgi:membrane-associated phospholipid phosphatase